MELFSEDVWLEDAVALQDINRPEKAGRGEMNKAESYGAVEMVFINGSRSEDPHNMKVSVIRYDD